MFNNNYIEPSIEEIIIAVCYNLGMIEEDNILISNLKLSDLQILAETLIKIIKISDGERKKKTENVLSDVVGFIDKALKNEIRTSAEYYKMISDTVGGEEKFIKNAKRRIDELSKRPKRIKSDNQ